MKHITILAIPGALGSTISIPLEMLSAANDIARARRQRELLIEISVSSPEAGPVVLAGGLRVDPASDLEAIDQTDLIFVPGLWGNPARYLAHHPQLCDWLARRHGEGATLCAITTGSFFVAEAGLLDDLPATTHWRYFDEFAARYSRVNLQRKRFITRARRIYCTGSVNAVRDIMLHFIEGLFGVGITEQVARHFTHELKRSYESMLLDAEQHSTHHDETIIKVQEWLQDNFALTRTVAQIAGEFQLSVRSLNRRFKLATNTTPLQYLQELRINQARDLLKHSNLVVAEVADKVGYQDASYFVGLFKKLNGVTPNEYRRMVRNKQFVISPSS